MDSEQIMMDEPLLILVNGLPGAGKTTLARRRVVCFGASAFRGFSVTAYHEDG